MLNQLKDKLIKNNQIQVEVISLDLTEPNSFDRLVEQTSHQDIGLVIPNAGIEEEYQAG